MGMMTPKRVVCKEGIVMSIASSLDDYGLIDDEEVAGEKDNKTKMYVGMMG